MTSMMDNAQEEFDVLAKLVDEFSKLGGVQAVVLSGSKTSPINDGFSDYDVYVYSESPISLEIRENIIRDFTEKYTVGNTFFEDGDEFFIENPKMYVDIMYRRLDWATAEIDWVWRKHNAKLGYSTCFLHNLRTSKILFDRDGDFQKIVDELNQPFPLNLKKNIVAKNYPMLRKLCGAPYFEQVQLAVKRNDLVSQNHRTSALLASYFDIIFALNEQTHPGEKKLVAYCQTLCKDLPEGFKYDVENVVKSVGSDNILTALTKMLDELDVLLQEHNLI